MRNILPLASLGCIVIVIFGVLAAGAIMLGIGINQYFEKGSEKTPEKKGQEQQPGPGPAGRPKENRTLKEARQGFKTERIKSNYSGGEAPPALTARQWMNSVSYDAPPGPLNALLSKNEANKKSRPAVIWVHSRFGNVNDLTCGDAKLFHDRGLVVMCPEFRGESGNPGEFEMFFGEVDDLIAAVEFLAKSPGVDPKRIYVVGHQEGGTLALLAAATGTDKVRAFFAIDGIPDLEQYLKSTADQKIANVMPPFDWKKPQEAYLRSALPFVGAIRQPTYFIKTSQGESIAQQAAMMEKAAKAQNVKFQFVNAAGHRDAPRLGIERIVAVIADKIAADDKIPVMPKFTDADIKRLSGD
jgi:alpha/beta superfamily hydrolase